MMVNGARDRDLEKSFCDGGNNPKPSAIASIYSVRPELIAE
jgi:hypothetical protein